MVYRQRSRPRGFLPNFRPRLGLLSPSTSLVFRHPRHHPPIVSSRMERCPTRRPACLDSIDPDSLASCNGLHVYRDPDFPLRILVPPALREPLTRQHHADLHHLAHAKVHTSLARHYYWPSMQSEDRTAPTFIPPLLDAIWFTRGSPEVIHSDAAPELLSALLTDVLEATGTHHTTTCGHNAQSNGEIESWWRFWNRCMKLLSPTEYLNWPSFSQRICFAHNSVSHESLGGLCPFDLDFGSPPVSPFFTAVTPLPHPDDDTLRADSSSPVSPAA